MVPAVVVPVVAIPIVNVVLFTLFAVVGGRIHKNRRLGGIAVTVMVMATGKNQSEKRENEHPGPHCGLLSKSLGQRVAN